MMMSRISCGSQVVSDTLRRKFFRYYGNLSLALKKVKVKRDGNYISITPPLPLEVRDSVSPSFLSSWSSVCFRLNPSAPRNSLTAHLVYIQEKIYCGKSVHPRIRRKWKQVILEYSPFNKDIVYLSSSSDAGDRCPGSKSASPTTINLKSISR